MTLTGSHVDGNTAGDEGGGIYSDEGSLTLTSSTVSGNTSNDQGGGLHLYNVSPTITASTIADNTSQVGGAVLEGTPAPTPRSRSATRPSRGTPRTTTAVASTSASVGLDDPELHDLRQHRLAGRRHLRAGGGLALTQVTVSNNSATSPSNGTAVGGIQIAGVGAGSPPPARATPARPAPRTREGTPSEDQRGARALPVGALSAAPTSTRSARSSPATPVRTSDVNRTTGTMHSDHSVLGTVDARITVTDAGGTQSNVTDPGLGALGEQRRAHPDQALVAGSPAIDKGPVPEPTFPGNDFDQRGSGFDRVVNGVVDVGAYEVQPPAPGGRRDRDHAEVHRLTSPSAASGSTNALSASGAPGSTSSG